MEGVVKFFNVLKGFGFITEAETGTDFFVHFTNTLDKIQKDDKVSFEIKTGQRGPKAVNVKRLKE